MKISFFFLSVKPLRKAVFSDFGRTLTLRKIFIFLEKAIRILKSILRKELEELDRIESVFAFHYALRLKLLTTKVWKTTYLYLELYLERCWDPYFWLIIKMWTSISLLCSRSQLLRFRQSDYSRSASLSFRTQILSSIILIAFLFGASSMASYSSISGSRIRCDWV